MKLPSNTWDKFWTLHDVEVIIPQPDMAGRDIYTGGMKCNSLTQPYMDKYTAVAEDFGWGEYKGNQSFFYSYGGGTGLDQTYGIKSMSPANYIAESIPASGPDSNYTANYDIQIWWNKSSTPGRIPSSPGYLVHEDDTFDVHVAILGPAPESTFGQTDSMTLFNNNKGSVQVTDGDSYTMFDWTRYKEVQTKLFGMYNGDGGVSDWYQGIGISDIEEYDMGVTGSITSAIPMHQKESGGDLATSPYVYWSFKKGIVTPFIPPPWWSCFTGDTKVTMADGSKRNINLICEGEKVLSYDFKAGKVIESTVVKTFEHKDTPWYLVINGELRLTPNHKIHTGNSWKKAKDFQLGDYIQAHDGICKVETMERIDMSITTYNIQVDNDNHNYFAENYLVHNKSVFFPPNWPPAKPKPPRPVPPGGGGPQLSCFTGDTKIWMSDDSQKEIKDVRVGDTVKVCNTDTNEIITSEVCDTFIHPDTEGYITINDDLNVTPNHELYNGSQWKPAKDFQEHDDIQFFDTTYRNITSIKRYDKVVTTYNIQVSSEYHNYYANGYLAHNKTVVVGPPALPPPTIIVCVFGWPPGGGGPTGTPKPSGGNPTFPPNPTSYPPVVSTAVWNCTACGTHINWMPKYVGESNSSGNTKTNIKLCNYNGGSSFAGRGSNGKVIANNQAFSLDVDYIQAYIDIPWYTPPQQHLTTMHSANNIRYPYGNDNHLLLYYPVYRVEFTIGVDKDGKPICISEFRTNGRTNSGYGRTVLSNFRGISQYITYKQYRDDWGLGQVTVPIKGTVARSAKSNHGVITGRVFTGTNSLCATKTLMDNLGTMTINFHKGQVLSYELNGATTSLYRSPTAGNAETSTHALIYVPFNGKFLQPLQIDTAWEPASGTQSGATIFAQQGTGYVAHRNDLCYTVTADLTGGSTSGPSPSAWVPTVSANIRNFPIPAGLNPDPYYYATSNTLHASAGHDPDKTIGAIAMSQQFGRPRKRFPVACASSLLQHHDHQQRRFDVFNLKYYDQRHREIGVMFPNSSSFPHLSGGRAYSLTQLHYPATHDRTVLAERLKFDHNQSSDWGIVDFTWFTGLSAQEFALYLDQFKCTTLSESITSTQSYLQFIGFCTYQGSLTAADGSFYFAALARCNKPSWAIAAAEIGGTANPSEENYVICTSGANNMVLPYMTFVPTSAYNS